MKAKDDKPYDIINISAEVLRTGEIAIYIRKKGEPAEAEHLAIANNGPGPNNPQKVLKQLIKKYCNTRGEKE